MRIAIDGAALNENFTGVGRYLLHLLEELTQLDSAISYTLFLKNEYAPSFAHPNVELVFLHSDGGYFAWQNSRLRNAVRRGCFDLFWSPNYTLPLFVGVRSWLTVHDVSWRARPGDYPFHIRHFKHLTAAASIKKAMQIFTDSDFSKEEIQALYPVATGKITRIHPGVADSFYRESLSRIQEFVSRHSLAGGPIIGFLGGGFKRRHISEILEAFGILKKDFPGMKLLLAGENYDPGLTKARISAPGIVRLERIAEPDLNSFYSCLSLLVYVSDYEGFGFPPIEALACGTVPLLQRRSSLAEIFDGMALFVNRPDPVGIATAIRAFLENEEVLKKEILAEWERRRPYFSWKRAAGEYLHEIRNLR